MLATDPSWAPREDHNARISERSWLQGVLVSAIAFGIITLLYILTFNLLLREKNRLELKRRLPLLIYITVLFLCSALFMCTLTAITQMAFIDNRNYPGGPNQYENYVFSAPVGISGNVAFVLTNWLCDALLVWRFKVIYQMCCVPLWIVMFFPCLMFAGSVALGTGFLIQVSTPGHYVTNGINFTSFYLSLSPALNVTLTVAIVLRLLAFRYRIVSVMGPKYGTHYTSTVAMIVESAALYSAIFITFLVLFGIGNTVSQAFVQLLVQIQTIATLLILFRVAQGRGWKEETATHVMTAGKPEPGEIRFTPALADTSLTLANPEA